MKEDMKLDKGCSEAEEIDFKKILGSAQIGLWRVKKEPDKAPCFFGDQVMDALLGITAPVTPEERYTFHQARIHPDDMELFQEYASRLSETRTEIVYRYQHPQDGEMLVRCAGVREMEAEDGICIVGIHQNISDTTRLEQDGQAERRLSEKNQALLQEQEKQENYYRELLDLQSCAVMAYTIPNYKLRHMNAQALRIYDMESVEQAQQRLHQVVSSTYYPEEETIERLRALRQKDGSLNYEAVIYPGQEKECRIMATTKVLHSGSGERVVVTTFMDLSEVNLLKNALQAAQHANQAKTMFLNNMSHDIRTPMNAIIGFTSLAASHLDQPQKVKEYLTKISVSSEHLLLLINDVLDMSRIESGKVKIEERSLYLPDLLQDIQTIIQPTITSKQLEFVIDMEEVRDKNIIADKLRLNQILLNILSNSVKFNKIGGRISLQIRQLCSAPAGCASYQFIIQDTGIGMKQEFVDQIFEAFAREETATVSGIPGTGLGMSITKNIVDMMDGTIQVESKVGVGTEFTVFLTFRLSKVTAKKQEAQEHSMHFSGKTVLLAEDNLLNQEIAVTILEGLGLTVDVADDGTVAVEKMKRALPGQYSLILMDIQMPVMDGYEATRQIRSLADPQIASVPIVAMTANAFSTDQEKAHACGMNGYLTKPISVQKMQDVLNRVLTDVMEWK